MRITGRYEALGSLNHFIPHALPPQEPTFHMDHTLIDLYGKAMHQLGRLNEVLFQSPVIGISEIAERLQKSYNSVSALIDKFEEIGIVSQMAERRRNRTYLLHSYLAVLEKEYV